MLLSLLIAIFVLALYEVKIKTEGYHLDYLSKEKTNSIKGIFILLIVLIHSNQYIISNGYGFTNLGDGFYLWFFGHMSQLVVAMFLFYSGYGVSESFKMKGYAYAKSIPVHRILATLLNFDVAVVVFIVVCFLLSKPLSFSKCFLSLTGWETVGNSNWYIFVILLCYFYSYIAFQLKKNKPRERVLILSLLCLLSVILLSQFKEGWWYGTILCYPAGFVFSTYRIEIIQRKYYWCVLLLCVLTFFLLSFLPLDPFGLRYNLESVVFAFLVIQLTLKVGINNKPLQWMGKNLFPVYIYMRLPMMIFDDQTPRFVSAQPAMFIMVSFVVTLVIASMYRFWQIRL